MEQFCYKCSPACGFYKGYCTAGVVCDPEKGCSYYHEVNVSRKIKYTDKCKACHWFLPSNAQCTIDESAIYDDIDYCHAFSLEEGYHMPGDDIKDQASNFVLGEKRNYAEDEWVKVTDPNNPKNISYIKKSECLHPSNDVAALENELEETKDELAIEETRLAMIQELQELRQEQKESVNHPEHYGGDTTYEAIKVIEAWKLGFCLGNAVKYISRAGKKNPDKEIEDLKKTLWYVERRIQQLENKTFEANHVNVTFSITEPGESK